MFLRKVNHGRNENVVGISNMMKSLEEEKEVVQIRKAPAFGRRIKLKSDGSSKKTFRVEILEG